MKTLQLICIITLLCGARITAQPCDGIKQDGFGVSIDYFMGLDPIADSEKALAVADSLHQVIDSWSEKSCPIKFDIQLRQAFIYHKQFKYNQELNFYIEIIQDALATSQFKYVVTCYLNMSRTYLYLNSLDEPKDVLEKAKFLINQNQLDDQRSRLNQMFSMYYREKEQLDSAAYYIKKAIDTCMPGEDRQLANLYGFYAMYLTDPDSIKYYLEQKISFAIENKEYEPVAYDYLNLNQQLTRVKSRENRDYLFDKAYHYSQKMDTLSQPYFWFMSRYYRQKRSLARSQGKIDDAFLYGDSIGMFVYQRLKQANQTQISQIAEKSKHEIERLRMDSLAKEGRTLRVFLALGSLFTFALIYIYMKDKLKRKQIEAQNEKISTQNLDYQNLVASQSILLMEVHHRVKNNLQLVQSIFKLQLSGVDQKTKSQIQDVTNKIRSIALIHEQLQDVGDSYAICMRQYLNDFVRHFQDLFTYERQLSFQINMDQDVRLNIDTALPIGLICSELISNSLKHAPAQLDKIEISIDLKIEGSFFTIAYQDNGDGYTDPKAVNKGVSFTIIENMAKQLDTNF